MLKIFCYFWIFWVLMVNWERRWELFGQIRWYLRGDPCLMCPPSNYITLSLALLRPSTCQTCPAVRCQDNLSYAKHSAIVLMNHFSGHSDLALNTPPTLSVMERKRSFQMKQRFERCKTPMGSVPISVIMGFDYPLGQVTSREDNEERRAFV